MKWDFMANNPDELANIGDALLDGTDRTACEEGFQMTHLLKALSSTQVLTYPVKVRHTGKHGIPDFAIENGSRSISVEIAKITNQNLEHARSLQRKFPERPSRFTVQDICNASSLARRLKHRRDQWASFVASRMTPDALEMLRIWDESRVVPTNLLEAFVHTLNSIIEGPPLSEVPDLVGLVNPPVEVEGFPVKHTASDNKFELEEAFTEELARPINPTLMTHRFFDAPCSRLSRQEVFEMGFSIRQMEFGGPTIEEEERRWLEALRSELDDKSQKLSCSRFSHGDEDWLVLWDLLGSADWQLCTRQAAVSALLAPCWNAGWFSRVFIQDRHFVWQLMFGSQESVLLPGKSQ